MRVHIGPPPEDPSFDPSAQGWQAIWEPGPILVQFIAIPLAAVAVLGLGALIRLLGGIDPFPILFSVQAVLLFLVLVPFHELLHLLAHPESGLTSSSVMGIWLSRAVVYAAYLEPMPRARFLAALIAPFIGFSLLPILVLGLGRLIPMEGTIRNWLALMSLVNGVASAGDLVGLALIGLQTPRGALIRDKGWRSYWKKGN